MSKQGSRARLCICAEQQRADRVGKKAMLAMGGRHGDFQVGVNKLCHAESEFQLTLLCNSHYWTCVSWHDMHSQLEHWAYCSTVIPALSEVLCGNGSVCLLSKVERRLPLNLKATLALALPFPRVVADQQLLGNLLRGGGEMPWPGMVCPASSHEPWS